MKNIQDKIKTYKRKKAIEKITKGLGKITEDETTIYCYVDEKTFKKNCNYGNIYGFNLNHHPVYLYGKAYLLRKNFVYIFDGISFDKPITFYISTPKEKHNYVKFQNCSFTDRISINEAENVEFIGSKSKTYNMRFYVSSKVKNLKFTNDNTLTSVGLVSYLVRTYIDINCDTLEMYNTEFCSYDPKINVKNLIMKNSDIYGSEKIELNADKINLEKSEIYSLFEIKLNTKECNDFACIKAEDITYNGLSLFEYNDSYEEIDKLLEARQSLVDNLATIKFAEESYQKEEVSRYKKELKSSPLIRRLTKKNT